LRATAKRIAARWREEAEPEGQSCQVPPKDRRPFPRPQAGGSDAPHVWAAQFSRSNRRLASGRVGRLRGRPRCTQYTIEASTASGANITCSRPAPPPSGASSASRPKDSAPRSIAPPLGQLRRTQMFKAIIIAGTIGK